MKKKIICIECPKGCVLSIDLQNDEIVSMSGNECPKGQEYALSEIKNPLRIFTSSVLTQGLSFKMMPVRTDKPIPKHKLFAAIKAVKKIRLCCPVNTGDVIVENFLGLDVNLVATRNSMN
ncbi:MAG: DUF1667 domain-containing protein [Candidatus Omnitrophica bacterium]|nr:DUF1667 domain-containing protein [Candidatus Omnitrophota bacterium]